MNALLNITVRVDTAQATGAVTQLRGAFNSLNTTGGGAGGALGGLNNGLMSGMANMEKFGKNLQWTGRQLEYNFTLPILLAGGAATKWAFANEAAMAQVIKAYGAFSTQAIDVKAETDALAKTFELLSDRFGVNQAEVIKVGEEWAQAGASGVALAKATRLTLETSVLAQEATGAATTQLLTIQGAYRLNTDQLRGALVSLNAVQVTTAITFGGLIDGVTRAGGAAAAAGIDINHLAAMMAALVPATGTAAGAGNGLRTIISRLMAPTRQAADELKMMGINVTDASWQAMNGVQRIEALAHSFGTLSDSQRNLAASVIGSRWQINRLDILMNDINNSTGVYHTALKNTNDLVQANTLYFKQLGVILDSNPAKFKIITTTLQNSLASAMIPMLPILIQLMSSVAHLAQAFSNLSPGTREVVMLLLLMLAAVGPIARYIGSVTLLFTTFGKAAAWLAIQLFGTSVAEDAVAVSTQAANSAMETQGGLLRGLGGLLGSLWNGFMFLVKLPFSALISIIEAVGTAMVVVWDATMAAMGVAVDLLMPLIEAAFWAIVPVVGAVGLAVSTVWDAAVAFMATAVDIVMPSIEAAFWAIVPVVEAVSAAISTIIALIPEEIPVLLIAAIAALVIGLGVLIYRFRNEIVGGIEDAFNSLPRGIQNALVAVVNMVKDFATQVAEWLSYINPFAHHSPSLVENVQRGMKVISKEHDTFGDQYAGQMEQAAQAHDSFNKAVQPARDSIDREQMQDQRSNILQVAPNAGSQIDAVIAQIFRMRDAASAVNVELNKQQKLVDDMQRQIDQDMKPYTDALFANKMAQDQVNLALLKYKEAGISVDSVKNKMASLRGEMEKLQAQKTDLRLAGAGSDILAGFDQQMSGMEAQQSGLQGQAAQIQALQDQLVRLQDTAQRINLEKDLRFNPQLKELDDQKKKLQEIQKTYSDITSEISNMEQALNSMSQAATQSTAKQKAAKAPSLAAAQFAAAAGANFPPVTGTTIPGLGREGGLPDIKNFNADLQKELDKTLKGMGGLDMFKPIKDMWNGAWKWVKDNVGSVLQPVWDAVVNFFAGANLGGAGNGIGRALDAIKGAFNSTWNVIKEGGDFLGRVFGPVVDYLEQVFGPVFMWLANKIVEAWHTIEPEINKWSPVFSKVSEAIGNVLHVLGVIFDVAFSNFQVVFNGLVLVVKIAYSNLRVVFDELVLVIKIALMNILTAWKLVWPILAGILGPIFDGIVGTIKGALTILRGVISFVLDLINGDWKKAWNDVLTILQGMWDIIVSTVEAPIKLIWGMVKGLIDGIIGFFTFLWDKLVGHSIIPDLMNAIVGWFLWLPKKLLEILSGAIGWLVDKGGDIIRGLINGIGSMLGGLWGAIGGIVGGVLNTIGNAARWLYNKGRDIIQGIIDGVGSMIGNLFGLISGLPGRILDALGNLGGLLWNAGHDLFQGLVNGIKSVWNHFVGFWNGLHLRIPAVSVAGVNLTPEVNIGLPGLPWLASGGDILRAGLAIVGERGPELVSLPAGAHVFPNGVIPSLPGQGGMVQPVGNVTHNHVTHYTFSGNMVFPNITKSEDAGKFLKNLRSLVG